MERLYSTVNRYLFPIFMYLFIKSCRVVEVLTELKTCICSVEVSGLLVYCVKVGVKNLPILEAISTSLKINAD